MTLGFPANDVDISGKNIMENSIELLLLHKSFLETTEDEEIVESEEDD